MQIMGVSYRTIIGVTFDGDTANTVTLCVRLLIFVRLGFEPAPIAFSCVLAKCIGVLKTFSGVCTQTAHNKIIDHRFIKIGLDELRIVLRAKINAMHLTASYIIRSPSRSLYYVLFTRPSFRTWLRLYETDRASPSPAADLDTCLTARREQQHRQQQQRQYRVSVRRFPAATRRCMGHPLVVCYV